MATDNFEAELEGLVKKLNKIQSAVGGKTSKKYVTGKDGKIDPFLELQESIMDRIRKIQQVIEEIRDFGGKESKSRDTVVNQQELRRLISLCSEEWQEMNNLYQNEARKRKSKFTQDELKERLRILTMLQRDIEEIKDNQRAGYVADYKPRILVSMEESELFNAPLGLEEGKGTKTSPASRNVEMMTDQHRAGLQMLKERDAVIDQHIDAIGEGVTELKYIALAQSEEVKLHNRMLDTMESKIESVQDQLLNVNAKLKTTLEEARSADKILVDIFCLLILIGLIVVLYQLTKQKN